MKHPFKDIFFKEDYLTDFYFFNVGYEKCQSNHQFGPTLRDYYLLHFIVDGKGEYSVDGRTYFLSKGDFFLIKPNEETFYKADSHRPWEYYWLGFSGTIAEELLALQGFGRSDYVGNIPSEIELREAFEQLLQANMFDDRYKLTNQAAFYTLFSQFRVPNPGRPVHLTNRKNKKYKDSFLLSIQNNYYRHDLTIKEIAKSMYLNASYLSQVIKEELGVTAQHYLISYRMTKAKGLLLTTDMTIEEVADAVGYNNRHSFTRAFKNTFQLSPSQMKSRRNLK